MPSSLHFILPAWPPSSRPPWHAQAEGAAASGSASLVLSALCAGASSQEEASSVSGQASEGGPEQPSQQGAGETQLHALVPGALQLAAHAVRGALTKAHELCHWACCAAGCHAASQDTAAAPEQAHTQMTVHAWQVLSQGLAEAMQKLDRSLPPSRSPSPQRERNEAVEAC